MPSSVGRLLRAAALLGAVLSCTGSGVDPFDDPVGDDRPCSGCLCSDPTWSCDRDSWVTADGLVNELHSEAGLFEIEPVCYDFLDSNRCSEAARLFYVFQPADEQPAQKPLVLLFNGGPNFATTAGLFAYHTARYSLTTGQVESNEHRWTKLANLLYVDARHSGFSYALQPAGTKAPNTVLVPEFDAADLLRVLLRFLNRHPQLQSNEIIVVGESYGGLRASVMLDLALHPQRLVALQQRYRDPALANELTQHFAVVFPTTTGDALTPTQIATQFSHLVLIQPALARDLQSTKQAAYEPFPSCLLDNYEPFKCDEPKWDNLCFATTTAAVLSPQSLNSATEVDVLSIAWLGPDARKDAQRLTDTLNCDALIPATEFATTLGQLEPADGYYRVWVNLANEWTRGNDYADAFLSTARYVRTFITNAALDAHVWAPALVPTLADYEQWVTAVHHDTTPQPNVLRPGWMQLHYQPHTTIDGQAIRQVRFPHYADAGHLVSRDQPAELLTDVRSWYEASQ